jgi:hypothetical protein
VYCFEPAKNTWKTISPSGPKPSKVYKPGFSSTLDGVIYQMGGSLTDGKQGGSGAGTCARVLIGMGVLVGRGVMIAVDWEGG